MGVTGSKKGPLTLLLDVLSLQYKRKSALEALFAEVHFKNV